MKSENKSEVKKNVITGASTAAGALAGATAGIFFTSENANANDIEPELKDDLTSPDTITHTNAPGVRQATRPVSQYQKPEDPSEGDNNVEAPENPSPEPEPTYESDPIPGFMDPTSEPIDPSGNLEVLSYERVTGEDGSEMDVAVVSMDGNEVNVIDVNLDGYADFLTYDANQDGQIGDAEVFNVEGSGIMMQSFHDDAGFNPGTGDGCDPLNGYDPLCWTENEQIYMLDDNLTAQNDLPDYVNDANVDSFMA